MSQSVRLSIGIASDKIICVCAVLPFLALFFLLTPPLRAIELMKTLTIKGSFASGADFRTNSHGKLIVGSAFDSSMGDNAGKVIVIDIMTGDTSLQMYGDIPEALFGFDVDFVPDFDGDGVVDYLVGAPGQVSPQSDNWGRVFIFSGATGDTALKAGANTLTHNLGASLIWAGDLDGDGLSDIVTYGPFGQTCAEPGLVMGYLGDTVRVNWLDVWGWGEDTLNSNCGLVPKRIRRMGDINNDGFDDVMYNLGIRTPIMFGGASPTILEENFKVSELGFDGIGDVNKDGYDDILVGNRFHDQSRGEAAVISGFNRDTLYYFEGEKVTDAFGETVLGCGDFDGDTYPDFVVGASNYVSDTAFISRPGKIYVYSGRDGHLIDTVIGNYDGHSLGIGLEVAGDINGDGKSDIIVSTSTTEAFVFGASSCCVTAGDYNNDSSFNIADVTAGIARIFTSSLAPICPEEADSNGDGSFNIADITFGIARIFASGSPPVCP